VDVQEVRKLDAYLKKLFGNGRVRVVPKGAKTADVFVGEDGLARAVRFVRPLLNQESTQ